ncbi:hypothetical protein BV898_08331 [Hypsibius exemplaris]|uniref:G-protein coupled receptors family 1 profile domain-containing protein n=1 Tax=Hypsibius exemplaris TaxID=2072580 RepID=A0A1W0WQS8_HYPEX|nr:hypothetical protein BV898_08331 [Hypsibius exemplaris]
MSSNNTFNLTTNFSVVAGLLTPANKSLAVVNKPERTKFQHIFTTVTFLVALCTNGFLLLVFLQGRRRLLTPFTVYIVNLLLGNVLLVAIEFPFMALNLYSGTFDEWVAGDFGCTVWLYGYMVFLAGIFGCHALIAISRVWAMVFPMHYRTRHTIRTAVLICLASWLYVHVFGLSGLIVDTVLYRHLMKPYFCTVNYAQQAAYFKASKLILFNLPELIMLLAFPVIGIGQVRRWRKRRSMGVVHQQQANQGNHVAVVVVQTQPSIQKRSHGMMVLAMLTVSVAVCWTPNIMYFTILTFRRISPPEEFVVAQHVLFSCQMILDPILFVLGLRSLREGVKRFLFFRAVR